MSGSSADSALGPRVAVAQLPGAPSDPSKRIAWAEAALGRAWSGPGGPRLILFPEACVPGYAPGRRVGGAAAAAGTEWARRAAAQSGAHIAMGVAEDDASELVLASPTGELWRYRKRYPTFAEAPHWRAGPRPVIVATALGRVGLGICADLVQPGLWAAFRGRVDLVLIAAAWGDYAGRLAGAPPWRRALLGPWMARATAHRERTLERAARALGVPVLYANACGPWRGAERFDGGSRVIGPGGETLAAVTGPGRPELGGEGAGVAEAALPPPRPERGSRLQINLPWRVFAAAHRLAARARA